MRHLAHLQRCHRGLRWRLQAHRLHSSTPGTPTESTQRRSTPATKSADQSGLGPQHGVCHRGPWGTICPQPPCTADTATPVIRQKPAEDEIPPGARDPEFVDNIDEIAGQRASVAEEGREFTEAILGAAHAVLPEARRTPRRLGWCERPAVRAALLAALEKKREARRQCKTKHTMKTWKALRAACKEVRGAIDKGIEVYCEEYVAELERRPRHRYMRGLYKHLKMTAGLGGRKTEGQQAIKDENGNLLRDKGDILRRWERLFGNLLNTKCPHSNHPSSRRYSSGGRHRRRRRPGQGRKSRSQYHSRQSQRTRRRRRQSGR